MCLDDAVSLNFQWDRLFLGELVALQQIGDESRNR
jgi:hypothetical protein